jgi:hypothetical protein
VVLGTGRGAESAAAGRRELPRCGSRLAGPQAARTRHLPSRLTNSHDGRVIEEGAHGDLLALGGQYAELFNLQASQYVT